MRAISIALAFLTLGWPAGVSGGPTAGCPITEGAGIAGVQIGMTSAAALAITGPPLRQQAADSQVIYMLRAPWSHLVAENGVVQRVATRAAECQTPRRVGPGSTPVAVRQAYAGASASSVTPTAEGDLLSYPFIGVAFLLRGERVEAVEVFRPEGGIGARAAPTPAAPRGPVAPGVAAPGPPGVFPAAAPGTWSIRTVSARVEGYTLVVTGTVENNSRSQSAYAEVRAFDTSGRVVATGDGPLYPSPVPTGKTATFEARIAIDEIIRRYTVTIRPIGSLSVSLAEQSVVITDISAFAAIAGRNVAVDVQVNASPPARTDFYLVVTNGSPLTVVSMTVAIEITGTCRVRIPAPVVPFREVVSASATVGPVRPGASVRVNIQLSEGPCLQFETWSAQRRVVDMRLSN